jgi:hypothetical protein
LSAGARIHARLWASPRLSDGRQSDDLKPDQRSEGTRRLANRVLGGRTFDIWHLHSPPWLGRWRRRCPAPAA